MESGDRCKPITWPVIASSHRAVHDAAGSESDGAILTSIAARDRCAWLTVELERPVPANAVTEIAEGSRARSTMMPPSP